jgi:hypothetical protein
MCKPSKSPRMNQENEAQNALMRRKRMSAREITWHAVKKPERKAACARDFLLFLKTYQEHLYTFDFSKTHLGLIADLEAIVLAGGLKATAMPRGYGKTTLCESACLWALLYGHRKFVVFIGSDVMASTSQMDSVKSELENNDLLDEDFPEVCCPVRALEGISHRCGGQLLNGERTHISWKGDKLVLPTVKGSPSSGSILVSRGITGRVRGLKHKTAAGLNLRPDLVVIDDPQTDESAASLVQIKDRLNIIKGAILGLAGHGQPIACAMPCTIIHCDDLADQMTDRRKNPEWNGERIPMVVKWPVSHEGLWLKEYQDRRKADMEDKTDTATQFYCENRAAMDEGAVVSWDACHDTAELSALQHAYNLMISRGPSVFSAEYQNEPIDETQTADALVAAQIAERVNAVEAGVVPHGMDRVCIFMDVNPGGKGGPTRIFWMAMASDQIFRSAVMAYGVERGAAGSEAEVYGALTRCMGQVVHPYVREDGMDIPVSRVLVDSGDETEVIYQWCRAQGGCVLPSKGEGRASDITRRRAGRRTGDRWCLGPTLEARGVRLLRFDTNYWKTFLARRLKAPMATPGALALYGRDKRQHTTLLEHLTSEYAVRVMEKDLTFDRWTLKPGRENHLFDCAVGCLVALSEQGCALSEVGVASAPIARRSGGWFSEAKKRRAER